MCTCCLCVYIVRLCNKDQFGPNVRSGERNRDGSGSVSGRHDWSSVCGHVRFSVAPKNDGNFREGDQTTKTRQLRPSSVNPARRTDVWSSPLRDGERWARDHRHVTQQNEPQFLIRRIAITSQEKWNEPGLNANTNSRNGVRILYLVEYFWHGLPYMFGKCL